MATPGKGSCCRLQQCTTGKTQKCGSFVDCGFGQLVWNNRTTKDEALMTPDLVTRSLTFDIGLTFASPSSTEGGGQGGSGRQEGCW